METTPLPTPAVGGLRINNVALATGDLNAAIAMLAQHGVEFVWADQPLNAARSSTMLRDPEGNLINIFGPRNASV
ncbi:VOC family protein [Paraburkholderia sp. SIMBA_030]|uniref:VOC family protein n=1 Tax=Paraburkholderia sp. SIMBA_030 TaxID=3085773 RepID=UPI00397C790A